VKEYGRLTAKTVDTNVADGQTPEEGSIFDLHLILILVQVSLMYTFVI